MKKKTAPPKGPFDYLPAERHLPSTREMMRLSRDELKADLRALDRKVDSIDHRITGLHSRIDAVDASVKEVNTSLTARIEETKLSLTARINEVNTTLSARINEVNTTLSARIDEVNTTLSARIDEVNISLGARIDEVNTTLNAKIDRVHESLTAQMFELRSLVLDVFAKLDSKIDKLQASVHEIGLRVENQESNNRIVLEGLTGHAQRQDRLEGRMDQVEGTVRAIAKYRPKGN